METPLCIRQDSRLEYLRDQRKLRPVEEITVSKALWRFLGKRLPSGRLQDTVPIMAVVLTVVILTLLPQPLRAEARQIHGNVIRIGADYTIDRHSSVRGIIIVFGGNISIEGELAGRAVAVGGTVRVEGRVNGELMALGGRAVLLRGASVTGRVSAIGGGVERAENVELIGEVNSVSLAHGLRVPDFRLFPFRARSVPVYALYLLGLYLTVLAVGYLFPEHVRNATRALAAFPWRSLWVGTLSVVLILPVSVLMYVSVAGRPLIMVSWLVFLAAKMLGYVAAVLFVGTSLTGRFGLSGCWALDMASGVLILGLIRSVPYIGGISGAAVFFFGLGAALISRLGMGGMWFSPPAKCRMAKKAKSDLKTKDA